MRKKNQDYNQVQNEQKKNNKTIKKRTFSFFIFIFFNINSLISNQIVCFSFFFINISINIVLNLFHSEQKVAQNKNKNRHVDSIKIYYIL